MPETSDLTLYNFAHQREDVLARLRKNPLEPWSQLECNVVAYFMGMEQREQLKRMKLRIPTDAAEAETLPLCRLTDYDLNQLDTPKWVTLFAWLHQDGLVTKYPTIVGKIAAYTLGNQVIQRRIESEIPERFLFVDVPRAHPRHP